MSDINLLSFLPLSQIPLQVIALAVLYTALIFFQLFSIISFLINFPMTFFMLLRISHSTMSKESSRKVVCLKPDIISVYACSNAIKEYAST